MRYLQTFEGLTPEQLVKTRHYKVFDVEASNNFGILIGKKDSFITTIKKGPTGTDGLCDWEGYDIINGYLGRINFRMSILNDSKPATVEEIKKFQELRTAQRFDL